MPMPIDPQAFAFARRIAASTGWRASDVYDRYMAAYGDGHDRASVERAITLLVSLQLDGESLTDVVLRVGVLIDEMQESGEEED